MECHFRAPNCCHFTSLAGKTVLFGTKVLQQHQLGGENGTFRGQSASAAPTWRGKDTLAGPNCLTSPQFGGENGAFRDQSAQGGLVPCRSRSLGWGRSTTKGNISPHACRIYLHWNWPPSRTISAALRNGNARANPNNAK